jgi:tetratricopeptide (TPR) repeat protein
MRPEWFFSKKNVQPIIILGLALITLAAYWPVRNFPFVNFDDDEYVYENSNVQSGFTPENVLWAMRSTQANNWHPLTWLSLMLDHELYGDDPGGYHCTNLFLHISNAILLFVVLVNLTGARRRSAIVAFLFALHPLHVESVAWVSERKDLLCALFFLLCIGTYADYSKTGKRSHYVFTLFYYALGLMAKPMIVTLPFVLLLLDFWPLRRLARLKNHAAPNEDPAKARSHRSEVQLLLEKIPFVFLSIVVCLVTLYAQKESVANYPVWTRLANAALSYAGYLLHTAWPVHLAFLYPFRTSFSLPALVGSIAFLCAVTIASVKTMFRSPWRFVGWFWFVGTLVPVIGLVQVGEQSMADRYAYIPLIGIFVIIAWEAARYVSDHPRSKVTVAAVFTAILGVLFILTRQQAGTWHSSDTLFRHALAVTENNHVAHNNLSKVFYENKQLDSALKHFSEAIKIDPTYCAALYNTGYILKEQGKPREALVFLKRAVGADPRYTHALECLAETYEQLGSDSAAKAYYKQAIASNDNCFPAWRGLGMLDYNDNRLDGAIFTFDTMLVRWPTFWGAHYYLGLALAKKNDVNNSYFHFSEAIRLNPTSWIPYAALGDDLLRRGQIASATQMYTCAIRLAPDSTRPRLDRAIVLTLRNKLDSALADYRIVLRLKPETADAHFYVGQVFQKEGMQDSALFHFREALRISPDNVEYKNKLREMRKSSRYNPTSGLCHKCECNG